MNNGFSFAKKSDKRTGTSCSYTEKQGTCMTSSCIVEIVQESATGYVDVPSDSEQFLLLAVAQQLVAIETEQSSFNRTRQVCGRRRRACFVVALRSSAQEF